MNKEQMWEVLQTCHLASYGKSYEDLITEGFKPDVTKVGVQLCSYLKSKEIVENYTEKSLQNTSYGKDKVTA